MKIGAQLYTVRAFTQTMKDFTRSMERIAKIGYQTVQLSAIGKEIPFTEAGRVCADYGLDVVLTHCDVNRILKDTDALIEEHKKMNCKYIGLGSMPEKYQNPEWIGYFKEDFREPVKKIRDAGMKLMYHNHAFEFERVNGKYLLEYLLAAFDADEMGITLDVYWVHHAGGDVCSWLEKLSDRVNCVHLKDIEMAQGAPVMAPVMEGNMNMERILKTLERTCCEYALVEQDTCRESPFVCLEKSYRNLSQYQNGENNHDEKK